RQALRRTLPDYMVPQHFVVLDALPLLPNGKLDRKALPAPADLAREPAHGRDFVAPHTENERHLAALWSELLGVPRVGAHDNFFDLGGHSMLAMQAIARMEQQTGRRINPRQYIFETLAQVAHAYDHAAPEPPPPAGGIFKRLFGGAREGA
ncbi:MAG: phosphopantetheine-binding protein, partial [Xanthomonadaceae bacterium]|nr:phosphopantetheine-binding protein [Xanthomonadaceae bacterium]